jgi:hypothetical protein
MAMTVMTRATRLLVLAALLPFAASAAAVIVHIEPGSWLSLSAATRRTLSRDALLYTAGLIIVAAPLAGVGVTMWRRPERVAFPVVSGATTILALAAGVFVLASATLSVFVFGHTSPDALSYVATSHATMWAVAFALATFGAFCGSLFADPLDAAACSVLVVLAATGGLLVTGASFADAPLPLIDVAVTASPLIAMTSSAHIDISRMAVPYQMSPLAHLQVQYPTWYAASAWYLAFAVICLLGLRWKVRSWSMTAAN